MIVNRIATLMIFLTAAAFFTRPAAIAAQSGGGLQITVGPEVTITRGTPENVRQFPYLSVFGNDFIIAISHHADAHINEPADGLVISRDGGKTFSENFQGPAGFHLESAPIRLRDGRLWAMMYPAYYNPADPRAAHTRIWTSPDAGRSWTATSATLHLPRTPERPWKGSNWCGFQFHRSFFEMPDGSLQGAVYGRFPKEKHCNYWIKSTDGGLNWHVVSLIATPAPGITAKSFEGAGEPAAVQCPDGSLLCVFRQGSFLPMLQTRSTDGGKSWSKPETLPGVAPDVTQSVNPDLCLMRDGVLVLSYGRPGCRLLFSVDGCGRRWSNPTTIYEGKTTGYTGVREIAPGRLLVVGDTGAKFKPADRFVQTIWGKTVEVKRANR